MNLKTVCVFMLCCCYANVAKSNSIQKDNIDFGSPNCKSIVCEQAHEQAKGLSKLALLDEFVSQTVFLLNDLMQNIDGEIEKSANSLLRYVHPNCESTQKILLEVIQKQKEKHSTASPVLGQGIKPMTEDGVDESGHNNSHNYHRSEDDGQKNDDGDYSQKNYNYDTEDSSGEQQFTHYDTSQSSNGGVFVTKDIPKEDQFTTGWNSQKTNWRGIDEENKDSKWKPNKSWKFDSTEQLSEHKFREGKTIKTGSSSRHEHKVCKGVDKGSAFWVPGLDQWCLDNCSKGYCPKTHCIC